METLAIAVGVVLVLLIGLVIYLIMLYNSLVQLRNRFKNAFAQIDVQLKRRYDLIPNLVETAKGYLKHERETLEAVIKARSQAASASERASKNPGQSDAMAGLAGAENMLTSTLGRLFALMESYPELKANQNMMQLSEEIASTENRISFARQAYNDDVMHFNNAREVFPNNIVAGMFNFSIAAMFEIDSPEKKKAPKVSF